MNRASSFFGRLVFDLVFRFLFMTEPGWIVLLVIAAVVIFAVVRRGLRTRGQRSGTLPAPREVWWAEVPFEDGPGSKDRPCLVLTIKGRTATVVKITSKHHDRPGVVPMPRGMVGDAQGRASWLETDELRKVPLKDFRRRVGLVDDRTWAQARRAVG